MRGIKLTAWRTPLSAATNEASAARNDANEPDEHSMVAFMQQKLRHAIDYALAAIAADVRRGLLETVGLESEWCAEDRERASLAVFLPAETNAEWIARAVDCENLEAWIDAENRLRIGISPWLSVKDIDQTVLCTIKVVHHFTGLIGVDSHDAAHNHRH